MQDRIRTFGGKLFVLKDGKERSPQNKFERNLEKKHLKAYLRGEPIFFYGKDKDHNPVSFYTKVIWQPKTLN